MRILCYLLQAMLKILLDLNYVLHCQGQEPVFSPLSTDTLAAISLLEETLLVWPNCL